MEITTAISIAGPEGQRGDAIEHTDPGRWNAHDLTSIANKIRHVLQQDIPDSAEWTWKVLPALGDRHVVTVEAAGGWIAQSAPFLMDASVVEAGPSVWRRHANWRPAA